MKHAMGLTLLMLLSLPLAAEQADLSTPKKALKYFDALGVDPSIDRASIIYHARTDDEQRVARAFASVDLELARLRLAATAKFDRDAGDAMVHALRDVTADDIDHAKETVKGDKATISGKGFDEPLPMVKVKGEWKVSITDAIAKSQATADDLVDLCSKLVTAMEKTEQELAAEKFANPSLLERAIKRRVAAILGSD